MLEFAPLKELSSQLLLLKPTAQVFLENPEPGLIYVRGVLPSGEQFEVYSTTSDRHGRPMQLGVFMSPDSDKESELYFDSLHEAVAFLTERNCLPSPRFCPARDF